MGTNFYAHGTPCPTCGREDDRLHIGKASAGWVFSLRIHPDKGINVYEDWLPIFDTMTIKDEYDRELTAEQMRKWIENRRRPDAWWHNDGEVAPDGVTYEICNYEFS